MNTTSPTPKKSRSKGRTRKKILLVLSVLVVLGGGGFYAYSSWSSPERRAERHYDNGIARLEAGDNARAYVEFRNVLRYAPNHVPTLRTLADALTEEGNTGRAYAHRLRLAELQPESAEANRDAALLAIQLQDWNNAEVYGPAAIALAPGDPEVQAVALMLDYRRAAIEAIEATSSVSGTEEVLSRARALAAELPDNPLPLSIMADVLMRANRPEEALDAANRLVAGWPGELDYHRGRLQVLNRLGDQPALEAALQEMVTRFPEDESGKALLIRYYMAREDIDGVEAFLRDLVPAGERDDAARINLLQFLHQFRGPEAARAELDSIIAEGTGDERFPAMRAQLDFEAGDRDGAIARLEALLAGAEPSDISREIRVILAQLFVASGNEVAARREIETVLAEDATMVPALRMQAVWMIGADRADDAIGVLRRALDQEPQDADAMTLMAEAYLRNGDRELAGEMMALAVAASNSAPEESLRHARFLMEAGRYLPAETVLIDSLRLAPRTPGLLLALAEIYVQIEDWPRAEQIERSLREIGMPELNSAADALRVAIFSGQQRNSDAVAFLEQMARADSADAGAQVAVLRAHLANSDIPEARRYLDSLLAEAPDDPILHFLDAALLSAAGDYPAAEARYRALTELDPDNERIWLELYRTLRLAGQPQEAARVLDAAVARLPDAADLSWAQAGQLEAAGDTEGAIAVYERLYARNSGASIVANNLASLLSTARSDPESLERAWAVARRLRDSDVAAFLDTYGWIAYRRGDYAEALRHLEPAAEGLPDDPMVLYHLGVTYAATGRTEDALPVLQDAERKAAAMGPAAAATAEAARAEIVRLESGPSPGQ